MDEVHQLIVHNQQLMDETQRVIAHVQESIFWAMVAIVSLTLLGVVVAAWGLYQTRGTKASVERVAAILERVEQGSQRMATYLFGKLGPLEMK